MNQSNSNILTVRSLVRLTVLRTNQDFLVQYLNLIIHVFSCAC